MKSIKNLERLQLLHTGIQKEQTGSSIELAMKMNISQRLVYTLIDQLKDYGAIICYDRGRKTYYYKQEFQLEVDISLCITRNNNAIQLFQGTYFT